MTAAVQLDSMLESRPGVCGGKLCLAGTRVPVLQVVTLYKRGETPEEMTLNWPHVSLSQIYAALAYYHANQAEVEQQLADESAEYDRLESEYTATSKR